MVEIKGENSAPISYHSLSLAHLLTSTVGVFGVNVSNYFQVIQIVMKNQKRKNFENK